MEENQFVEVEAYIMKLGGVDYLLLTKGTDGCLLKAGANGWEDFPENEQQAVREYANAELAKRK